MDFDATAGVDWHAEHLETGGCKARIRQPKVAATCGCVGLVLLLVVMAGRGRHRERVAGTSAMGFVNHTVTVESANTVNDCLSSPCLNGGSCVDLVDSYGCDCLSGFAGGECQTRQKAHCPADNHCDAEHALCVADGGSSGSGGSDQHPPAVTTVCEDDASFRDGSTQACAAYRGYGCDDTSYSGGTASATIKAACRLSCGVCSVSTAAATEPRIVSRLVAYLHSVQAVCETDPSSADTTGRVSTATVRLG